MIYKILAVGLLTVLLTFGLWAVTPAPTATELSVYSVTDASGNTVSAIVNPDTGAINLGFLTGPDGTAYSGTIPATGTFFVYKDSTYGSGTMANSLKVGISYSGANLVVALKGVSYTLEPELNALPQPGYHCRTSAGTGSCDQVNSNSDWWRCYLCCLALGCNIAG